MRFKNKITAFFVSFLLMLNMLIGAVPVSAEAAKTSTYNHDGYTVEYKVTSGWENNQNINVTITNTSDETIYNWALGYNAQGEISGLWNAEIYAEMAPEYIITGAGYNSDIAPGMSASFGYTLKNSSLKLPQDIINCAERKEITEGYNIYYNITEDSGNTYQADMIIENNSDTDISSWQLSFDGNSAINNLWSGKLIENNGNSFAVRGAESNNIISAGNSVRFSFSGLKSPVTEEPVSTEVTDENSSSSETEETSYSDVSAETSASDITDETAVTITDETSSADMTEETSVPEITEESTVSDVTEVTSDTVTEEPVSSDFIVPASAPEIGVVHELPEIKEYSEIIFGNYKLTGIVIPLEFDFEDEDIDPQLDSDSDGLPDYLERELGTKRFNPDTDGDGLPDGYEYFTLGTDPLKADTDDNGISDADEDFDEDKLSNIEEYQLGTNPFSSDTDYDGLSDYDEVNVYSTDPLKFDTDLDKVSDGDEVILGLDPNNPATHGYPDSEYTTKQTVNEDSEALNYINSIEGNPYTISIDITAAGVAKNCLSAGESGYSYSILENEAVLGVVPELTYSEGLSVKDVVLNFNLYESAVSDRLGVFEDDHAFDGISRFNIFKYFEDTNMLLPIQTAYNTSKNSVSAHVDEVGTYCLIDMEKWIDNIENMPANGYYNDSNEPANIVFCLDTRDIINNETFENTKNDIKAITEFAFERYSDIKVYVYYQQFGSDFRVKNNLLKDTAGKDYFTSCQEALKAVDTLKTFPVVSNFQTYDFVEASNFIIDTCDENIIAMYHFTDEGRVMGSIDGAKKLTQTVKTSKYTTKDNEEIGRIHVSLLTSNGKAIDENSYAYELAEISGGIVYSGTSQVKAEPMVMRLALIEDTTKTEQTKETNSNLIKILGQGNEGKYTVITSTGLIDSVKLKTVLNDSNGTDTDSDGLIDWNEVNVDIVNRHLKNEGKQELKTVNNSDLPLFSDLILHFSEWGSFKPYLWSESDFARYAYANCFDNVRILPILSSPVDADGDNDGIIDNYDKNALKFCGNNDDILNDYSEAFVTLFTSKPNEEVKINSSKSELKLFPYENSKTIEIIDNNSDNTYTVDCVVLTSSKSWVKVKYKDKFGYIDGDYVVVNNDNDSLLRIMFSDTSIINNMQYDIYWNKNGNISIMGSSKNVNTQSDQRVPNRQIPFSQSELGFLYSITKEIGDSHGLNKFYNNIRKTQGKKSIKNGMFEMALAISIHETSMGLAKNTWKSEYGEENINNAGTGYFQITSIAEEDFNIFLSRSQVTSDWLSKAIRLDKINDDTTYKRSYFYCTSVIAAGFLRRYSTDYDKELTGIGKLERIFQHCASMDRSEPGYRGSEFISILNELSKYERRWE